MTVDVDTRTQPLPWRTDQGQTVERTKMRPLPSRIDLDLDSASALFSLVPGDQQFVPSGTRLERECSRTKEEIGAATAGPGVAGQLEVVPIRRISWCSHYDCLSICGNLGAKHHPGSGDVGAWVV